MNGDGWFLINLDTIGQHMTISVNLPGGICPFDCLEWNDKYCLLHAYSNYLKGLVYTNVCSISKIIRLKKNKTKKLRLDMYNVDLNSLLHWRAFITLLLGANDKWPVL